MQILVSLVLAFAVMAALAVGVSLAGAVLSPDGARSGLPGPVRSRMLPRVAYLLLWVLIFGAALGMFGGA